MMQGTSANAIGTGLHAARQALRRLCEGFFSDRSWIECCEVVGAGEMPSLPRELLVHNTHMTPRLRSHYGQALRLDVRAERLDGDQYTRKIKLLLGDSREVAEFGIMRIDLRCVPTEARSAILEKGTPLGDILARHNVLTKVEPWAYVGFVAPCPILKCLRRDALPAAYGRLATIRCNGEAAVELLEVVPG